MTRQPLWPPKPKEFDRAGAGSHGRALAVDDVEVDLGIGLARSRRWAGSEPRSMVSVVATASMAPAPPRACPVTPLIEVTGGEGEPKTFSMACASARSLSGVEVPCALMWPISAGAHPGIGEGELHARRRPVAPRGGRGDVMGVGGGPRRPATRA